jgi:hypothetical protein
MDDCIDECCSFFFSSWFFIPFNSDSRNHLVEDTVLDFSQVNRFHYDPPPRQPRGGSEKLRNLDQYSSGEDFQVLN